MSAKNHFPRKADYGLTACAVDSESLRSGLDPPDAQPLPSLDSAVAIEKLLRRSEWSLVKFLRALDQMEARAELIV
jgi:hypothetical protein